MRAKDQQKTLVLRSLVSAITNEALAQKITDNIVSDDIVLPVLKRAAKQRKEAATQYREGNRPELAQTEEEELDIISQYLPEQMSEEEIRKVAEAKKEELGITEKKDMGKLMAAVMGEVKDKADGGDVKRVVDSLL